MAILSLLFEGILTILHHKESSVTVLEYHTIVHIYGTMMHTCAVWIRKMDHERDTWLGGRCLVLL